MIGFDDYKLKTLGEGSSKLNEELREWKDGLTNRLNDLEKLSDNPQAHVSLAWLGSEWRKRNVLVRIILVLLSFVIWIVLVGVVIVGLTDRTLSVPLFVAGFSLSLLFFIYLNKQYLIPFIPSSLGAKVLSKESIIRLILESKIYSHKLLFQGIRIPFESFNGYYIWCVVTFTLFLFLSLLSGFKNYDIATEVAVYMLFIPWLTLGSFVPLAYIVALLRFRFLTRGVSGQTVILINEIVSHLKHVEVLNREAAELGAAGLQIYTSPAETQHIDRNQILFFASPGCFILGALLFWMQFDQSSISFQGILLGLGLVVLLTILMLTGLNKTVPTKAIVKLQKFQKIFQAKWLAILFVVGSVLYLVLPKGGLESFFMSFLAVIFIFMAIFIFLLAYFKKGVLRDI